jgi:hypothetical protein
MAAPRHQCRILKYFSQIEHLFDVYLDSNQSHLLKSALDLVSANTFSIPQANVKDGERNNSEYYGALAHGVNVYLQAHDDNDYTYSATSVHTRSKYGPKDQVIAYFAFPRLGIAVPLQPGDILFFNPKEPHCVSSRCRNSDNIHCLSLYLKSTNIGLNDNGKVLTPEEETMLELHNATHNN